MNRLLDMELCEVEYVSIGTGCILVYVTDSYGINWDNIILCLVCTMYHIFSQPRSHLRNPSI